MKSVLGHELALRLLKLFKNRTGQKHSWNEVRNALVKAQIQDAWIISGQKLANWNNPKRNTLLEPRAFEAGALVTEMAGIYPVEDTKSLVDDIELLFFKALEGMWYDSKNLVYLYIHKVHGHNFAILHLCQKISTGTLLGLGWPLTTFVDFLATGFLYFENETHSKNRHEFQEKPRRIGQVEKFGGDSGIYLIGVSEKKMRLKLWSRINRYEVNFEAFCESSLSDGSYEPCIDNAISVSSYFRFIFKSTETDNVYSFEKANDPNAMLFCDSEEKKNIDILRKKFDENKWSVLPNVIN